MSISTTCKQIQDVNAYNNNSTSEHSTDLRRYFGINMLDSVSTSKTVVTTPTISLTSQGTNN